MTAPTSLAVVGQHQVTDHSDGRVVAIVDKVIGDAIDSGREWSLNDVRAELPACHPNLIGSRVALAARRGLIELVRFERSSLPSTHGAWIKVWRAAS